MPVVKKKTVICFRGFGHKLLTSAWYENREKQAEGDADTLIVNTAIEVAKSGELTAVVGDDIDLLVLLTALTPPETEIFFLKPGRGRIPTTLYSSHSLNNNAVLKDHILFLHAFSGCDSTSALFGKGKMSLSKIFKKEEERNIQAASTFKSEEASQLSISEAGKTIFLALYGAKAEISLNKHRYVCFKKGVAVGKKSLSSLPPTEDAARLHSLRVYHQIQFWLGNKILPENWGWRNAPNLSPVPATLPPAPKNIIENIFCSCSKGCEKACGCQKIGLKCSEICVNCSGVSCHNAIKVELEDEEIIDNILLIASDEGNTTPEFSDDNENQPENTEGNLTTDVKNKDNDELKRELNEAVEAVQTTTQTVKRLRFD